MSGPAPKSRRHRLTLYLLALGLVLRLVLAFIPRPLDDDTAVYAELGSNLLHFGTYGIADDGVIYPSLFRLPGYPLVLGLLGGHILLVVSLQIVVDLLGCLLLADLMRRRAGPRAGWWTLGLSATCLFTAIYSVIPMTESLSVFAVTGAHWAMARLLDGHAPALAASGKWPSGLKALLPLAAFSALAMLLRPDGALVAVAAAGALLWYGIRRFGWIGALKTTALFCLLAVLPLVPWTVRNELTFHVFQPLAPRHVNDPGERVNLGFYRWLRTWTDEYSDTAQVYWHAGLEPISLADLPSRAFDSAAERKQTAALIARYNLHHDVCSTLDADFAALAATRIERDPLRYFLWLPARRTTDMLLRPRVDGTWLPIVPAELSAAQWTQVAALGLLNVFYVVAALAALVRPRSRRRFPVPAFMLLYLLLRCGLLGTLENAEPRYTLELYPLILVAASVSLTQSRQSTGERQSAPPGAG